MTAFRKNILRMEGERGQAWLDNLPNLVGILSTKWELSDVQALPEEEMHLHYVLKAYRGKVPVILKIGLNRFMMKTEVHALRAYGGLGCVNILNHDDELCALLVQQLIPGTPLSSLFPDKDSDAAKITAILIEKLHETSPSDKSVFPTLKEWFEVFNSPKVADLPLLHKAKTLVKQLLQTSEKAILLHGDLHHDNILYNGASQWMAINPKGVLGERAYEISAFIINPINQILADTNLISLLEKRISCFAKCLGLEPWRLRDWSFVHCVLAACWNVEENLDPSPWLILAEVLHGIPTESILS